MKILITGCNGQLGYDLLNLCREKNLAVVGATRNEMPLEREKISQAIHFLEKENPDVVIHCAAYTQVDRAEDEPALCEEINACATHEIAKCCQRLGAKMIYLSTDYVFKGDGKNFYEVNDETGPQNIYGKTKLLGENLIKATLEKFFIVRISWVFGGEKSRAKNFVKTMLNLAKTHDTLTVVNDQIGSPTYTKDLAELLLQMAGTEKFGVYHATNEGICSWYDFAKEIFRQKKLPVKVLPVPSEKFPTKAKRPKNSRLSKTSLDAANFSRLPTWQNALERYLKTLE